MFGKDFDKSLCSKATRELRSQEVVRAEASGAPEGTRCLPKDRESVSLVNPPNNPRRKV